MSHLRRSPRVFKTVERLVPSIMIVSLLAGCFGGAATASPGGTASPDASTPAPSASASTGATGSQATGGSDPSNAPDPIGEDLGPFSCDLPIHEDATVPRTANIVDVRVGTHDGYDRAVFEFNDGLPEITVGRDELPFTQDASGFPIEVDGESFLRLTMRGGTKQTEEGTSSYDGPTEFDTGFSTLVHLVEGGDFEAQSTWYLGLSAETCVRVIQLTDDGAPRLVIDVEH